MGSDFAITHYPQSWRLTTLGEMLDECNGSVQTGPFGSQLHASDYVKEGVPSVMPKNIRVESIDETGIARISETDAKRLSKYLLRCGDIVYSRRGDVEKCSLVSEEQTGWLCGTGCLRVRLGTNSPVSPSYLHAYLSTPAIREWISRNAVGATMPNLNTGILRDVPLLLSTQKELERLGSFWASINERLVLNVQTNQTLEQMAQALFKSWFIDFDPVLDNALAAGNPIPEPLQTKAERRQQVQQQADFSPLPADIRALFPSEFEQTDEPSVGIAGWVPKGWELRSVSDAIEINPKSSLRKGEMARFADMKAMPTSGYMINEVIDKEFNGGTKFKNNDVLLARITPCLENGKTALVDFLEDDEVGFGSTEFIVMRGRDSVSFPFIACLAREESFRQHCIQNMVGSSGRQRVQNSCFDIYKLILPVETKVLKVFEKLLEPNFQKMTSNSKDINVLTVLRDTLLPKLISGEISLDQVTVE